MLEVTSFQTKCGNVYSFTKTREFYIFGCDEGVLISNYNFEIIKKIQIVFFADEILALNENLIIIGEDWGVMELYNIKK